MKNALRWLVELPCVVLHRMWWVPGWNRSAWLGCPLAAAHSRYPRFAHWYWKDTPQ